MSEASGGFVQPYNKTLKAFSRTLRADMTDAERHLWQRLRNKQVVVELDGSQHFETEYRIKDAARDEELVKLGIKVLRFDDRQVLLETEAVMDVIFQAVNERLKISTSNPS